MRALVAAALLLVARGAGADVGPEPERASPPVGPFGGTTQQLLVVTTEQWEAPRGQLQPWERTPGGPWTKVGAPISIMIGPSGLGWGAGDDPETGRGLTEPRKAEGDGRAPAGVFRLDGAFGRGEAPAGTKLSWRRATQTLLCVDDPQASDYNRVVETAYARPHASAEKLGVPSQYVFGIVVAHNRAPIVAGKGSCIFLHVWGGDGKTTAGCTAMEKPAMARLLRWLDPRREPRLVQLPKEAYGQRRRSWDLP